MRAFSVLLACMTVACVMAQPAPPAPTGADPLAVWEKDTDVDGGRAIYARNDSKAAITVTQLWLYECKNVNRACGELTPNVTVQPGQTAVVLTLAPAVHSGTMKYKFELRYK